MLLTPQRSLQRSSGIPTTVRRWHTQNCHLLCHCNWCAWRREWKGESCRLRELTAFNGLNAFKSRETTNLGHDWQANGAVAVTDATIIYCRLPPAFINFSLAKAIKAIYRRLELHVFVCARPKSPFLKTFCFLFFLHYCSPTFILFAVSAAGSCATVAAQRRCSVAPSGARGMTGAGPHDGKQPLLKEVRRLE